MGVARQFWLFVVPLLVGFSAAGLLVLAAVFPDELFRVGSDGYIATAVVACVALSVLVWQVASSEGALVGGLDGPDQQR